VTDPQGPLAKTAAEIPAPLARGPIDGVLLGYQRAAVALCASASVVAIPKSRRIGLTWGLGSYAALEAAKSRRAHGQNVFYLGYNLEMAREFVDVCGMWAKAFDLAAGEVGEEIFDEETDAPIKAFRIQFASGFKIVALPSRPRSLRGIQGIIILDEAAFHDDLAGMLKAAMALLMWGGKVIVVSSHNGVDNAFNSFVEDIQAGRRGGKVMTLTFADALAQGLYERVCLVGGKTPSAEGKTAWEAEIRDFYGDDADEELDCIPSQGAGSFLKPEDLAACEHEDAGKPDLYAGGLWYGGRDVARRKGGDGQIIWGFEMVGDVLWLRDRWEEVGRTFREQDDEMDWLMKNRRAVAMWIDQTGMGEKVVEDAQLRHGTYRINGVLLTGPNRLDLANSLGTRVENHTIRLPKNDPIIRADLRAIKKSVGAQGQITLVNDGEVHADRFWAAGLACRAADSGGKSFDYHPVPKRTALDARDDFDDADRGARNAGARRSFAMGRAW
jgi:phage FluMu gp28-like protein